MLYTNEISVLIEINENYNRNMDFIIALVFTLPRNLKNTFSKGKSKLRTLNDIFDVILFLW